MQNKKYPERGFVGTCKKCTIKLSSNVPTELQKARRKSYYWRHKEDELDLNREWRTNNPDKKYAYQLRYHQNNPDKMKMYGDNRKVKNHKISKKEWSACLDYFNHECAYCGLNEKEHYVQYRREMMLQNLQKEHVDCNGENDLSNCVPACKVCNDKKWVYGFDEWYNTDNPNYTQERYDKILRWINEDYKIHIKQKKTENKKS